jgi:hypothetical protein
MNIIYNGLFVKRAMINNITRFSLGLLLYRTRYKDSVTIACYYYTLIGLCHYKAVRYMEVWCYPYPPDYQRVTQNDFKMTARPHFFSQL